jgi:hypothetical protein
MNNNLTSAEYDFVWAFLHRNQSKWKKYIQDYFSFNERDTTQVTNHILNKLATLADTTDEN